MASLMKKLHRKLSPKKLEKRQVPTTASMSTESSMRSSSSAVGGVEQVFNYFDENGDGKISPAELRKALGEDRLSPEVVEAVVGSADSDGDGLLCLEDFTRLVEAEEEDDRGEDLLEAFSVYADGDAKVGNGGCITARSLRKTLESLMGERKSIGDCKAIIRCFDLNGDGVLSFEEFRTMMTMA